MKKLIASALLIALGGTAPASHAEKRSAAIVEPTVVLVHGAFADGSSWNKVIPLLQAKGLKAVAVQNPLTSLEDDVAAARRAIAAQQGPVVLVGHSWAGSVITQLGTHEQVKALVYVASFAPSAGENTLDGVKGFPTPPGVSQFVTDSDGFVTLPTEAVARDFAQDVSPEESILMAATQGPIRAANFEQKVTSSGWAHKPSWYIVATQDRMIHPDAQRALAKKIGAQTTELESGHVPMASRPEAVAEVIVRAARSATR